MLIHLFFSTIMLQFHSLFEIEHFLTPMSTGSCASLCTFVLPKLFHFYDGTQSVGSLFLLQSLLFSFAQDRHRYLLNFSNGTWWLTHHFGEQHADVMRRGSSRIDCLRCGLYVVKLLEHAIRVPITLCDLFYKWPDNLKVSWIASSLLLYLRIALGWFGGSCCKNDKTCGYF